MRNDQVHAVPSAHASERHDELWVFDHDGFGGVLTVECSPHEARRLALLIERADNEAIPAEALAAWINDGNDTSDDDQLLADLQDAYCGHWDTGADYAQELAEEFGPVTDLDVWPLSCINWSHAWRELETSGDNYAIPAPDGGVLIFRSI